MFRSRQAAIWPLIVVGALMYSSCNLATSVPPGSVTRDESNEARAEALRWIQLVDNGQYSESWDRSAGFFKQHVTKEQWIKRMKSARIPLESMQTRTMNTSHYSTSLPGVPDGNYVTFTYKTRFMKKKSAVEVLTVLKDRSGEWRVIGYVIQ